ncbi:MAG: hypothetical protein V3T49_08570 [Dehalococcoidia bacterium]
MQLRLSSHHLVLVIGLVAAFAVACGGGASDNTKSSAANTPDTEPTRVVIAVTQASLSPTATPVGLTRIEGEPALVVFTLTDRSIEGPSSIPAGLTTIRLQNDGSQRHSLTIMRANADRSARELEIATNSRSFVTAWAPTLGSVAAEPGESNEFTVRLIPGDHGAADWITDSSNIPWTAYGLYLGFTVIHSGSDEIEWPDDTIEIGLEDFRFTGLADLKAGENKLLLKNSSPDQFHELLLFPLDEGQSAVEMFKEFRYSANNNLPQPLGIGFIGPGQTVLYSLNLPAGEYAVSDLLPSEISMSGKPHVNMGMLEQITISE